MTSPLHLLYTHTHTTPLRVLYIDRVSQITVQNCQNFGKFAPNLINFGRKMSKTINIMRVAPFFISPTSRQRTTASNADVPTNCCMTKTILHIFPGYGVQNSRFSLCDARRHGVLVCFYAVMRTRTRMADNAGLELWNARLIDVKHFLMFFL